jgi:hypothetical protein
MWDKNMGASLLPASRAWGSVFDSCVSFDHRSLRKFAVGLPGSSGGEGLVCVVVARANAAS